MAPNPIPTILLSIFTIWATANAAGHHGAPAPAVDCSSVILNLADCLPYVTDGSKVNKPEGTCCSGLKTVLKSNPECLCESLENSAQLGVTLNVTKAIYLPSACHVSAPSVSNCGLSIVTGAAPAISPAGAVSPSSIAGVPTSVPGGRSDSAGISLSVGSLLVALLASSLSSI